MSAAQRRVGLICGWLCLIPHSAFGAEKLSATEAAETIKAEDLRKHVNVLASDTFEGREGGTRGGKAASVYIGQQFRKLGLAGGATQGTYYQEFSGEHRNVLGLYRGSDPNLRSEVIILGSHYDHVGYGAGGGSAGPVGHIHNGADDNASGVAMMLEIAEAFSQLETPPRRSVLFGMWDGEEKGLFGSRHWVANPTFPTNKVRMVVNTDMVGRLRQNKVEVTGMRSAPGLRKLLSLNNRDTKLILDFSWDLQDNSDHWPFFERQIPFFMPFTGFHDDYHRPSDDVDKLNLQGMQSIGRWVFASVYELAQLPEVPAYRAAVRGESRAVQPSVETVFPPRPSRLGATWDAKSTDKGIVLANVSPGGAAARAGLKPHDRLLKWGERDLASAVDFAALVLAARGPIDVSFERAGSDRRLVAKVTPDGSPARLGISWRENSAEPRAIALSRVDNASPAAQVGLQVNDRIYRVNDKEFANGEEFRRLVSELPPPLELLAERRGQIFTVRLPLAVEASAAESTADQ